VEIWNILDSKWRVGWAVHYLRIMHLERFNSSPAITAEFGEFATELSKMAYIFEFCTWFCTPNISEDIVLFTFAAIRWFPARHVITYTKLSGFHPSNYTSYNINSETFGLIVFIFLRSLCGRSFSSLVQMVMIEQFFCIFPLNALCFLYSIFNMHSPDC
jgi:hypothetical protein